MLLVRPAPEPLRAYVQALQRGWSSNNGLFHESFVTPAQFGSRPGLRFRIPLGSAPQP